MQVKIAEDGAATIRNPKMIKKLRYAIQNKMIFFMMSQFVI